tara:strand:+ start:257 stop:571 length:315 start_codon:yes stop_codon:yes gene_type:complete
MDTAGRTFIEHADCGEAAWLWVADDGCEWLPVEGRLPDLTDPATVGCLLALVRDAWGDRFLVPQEDYCHKALWCIRGRTGMPAWVAVACISEAEALVAALETAP